MRTRSLAGTLAFGALSLSLTSAFAGAPAPKHWAFQPATAPPVPQVKNSPWVRNPIDAFIAARHEAKGLTPAPEADRRTLIRRLSLDLTGLPPTPEEIADFIIDRRPDAYERLVERLLTSPRHGERWARHWLDVARWAESEGYESNHTRPYAWRYRDYVVRAFNDDRPFDVFLRQQIAGDEMAPYRDDNLIATGFLAGARLSSNEEDQPRQRNDMLVDVTNAVGSAFLGLTLHCAQCHNHRLDPVSARDYYRFQGFFVKGQPANLELRDPELWSRYNAAKPPGYDSADHEREFLYEAGRQLRTAKAQASLSPQQLAALAVAPEKRTPREQKLAHEVDLAFQFTSGQIEGALPPPQRKRYDALKKQIADMEKKMPDRPQTFGFYSPATSPHRVGVLPMKGFYPLPYRPADLMRARPYLLASGEVHRRGPELDVGWPGVLGPTAATPARARTALADWLTDPRNPLTARVYVNRLWQYHFGRGIVATPGDFGLKGAPPTHPELLDWLTSELVRSGWSARHVHRLIVTSATYRQASRPHAANAKIDPENALLWRWKPRRLESEAIRDAMLAVSGELDVRSGGPSDADASKSVRRSLYLSQRRAAVPAQQSLFDGPTAVLESCAVRHVSTVPLQALYLLNNEFGVARAKAFAARVLKQAGDDRARQIEAAFLLALGRPPDADDRAAADRFFAAQRPPAAEGEAPRPLVLFCQALMNLNEFVYLE